MVKYVKFEKSQQEKFMRLAKNASGQSWEKFANNIGVSRSMIFFYLDEHSKLPYETYMWLLTKYKLNDFEDKFEFVDYNIQKNVTLPDKKDPMLSELVGLILGDGNLSPIKYAITVTMNGQLDFFFVNTLVKQLFMKLFLKTPAISHSTCPKKVRLTFFSKKAFYFLSEIVGLPTGRRKFNSKNIIPPYFFNNKTLLRCALRGLFDTEGGIYPHNNTLPRIEIFNTSVYLLDSMEKAFKLLNFHPIKKINRIKLCRTSEVVRFFEEIQPHNYQKLIKYHMWKQNRRVPKNLETIKLLNSQYGCG